MLKYILFIVFAFAGFSTFAQTFSVSGVVKSAGDSSSLPGATAIVEKQEGTPGTIGTITNVDGSFKLEEVEAGDYILKIQFIGYRPYERAIQVARNLNVGEVFLGEDVKSLEEIEVTATAVASEQRGDTSVFNASSFKTTMDATAENLVQKMPGIAMVDGAIQAQGENVQQIFVDGKPFFGEDVQAALQSLPAEIIASVEVFDRRSDQSILTGFDDGERIKTINIITKPNRRKGQFGKTSVGLGTDERYLAGANVNLFNEDRRITISGLSNNINVLDYSANPNASADSRTQDGIINNNALAVSYADEWGEKLEITGSYLYNRRRDVISQTRFRDYILPSDSGQVYTENSFNTSTNARHRLFLRLEYKINERNTILWRPSVSFRHNLRRSGFVGNTDSENGPVNQTENTSESDLLDYDYFNRLFYNHQFNKKGRSFTWSLNNGYHTNQEDSYRNAENIFFQSADDMEILNQYIRLDRKGTNWETNVSYTEPIGENGRTEFEYEIGNRPNNSDRRLFNYSEQFDEYTALDTALSNTFTSSYLTQEYEVGYQYSNERLRAQAELEYQDARLLNDQVFPMASQLKRRFYSYLPSARFEYKFNDITNMELIYRTWTREPDIDQLQDVIDNSNPLQLRTGNPDLDQTYSNWIRARLRSNNSETNRSLYMAAHVMYTKDYIGSSTFIADEQIELRDDIVLENGSQLIRPVNLGGYREFRSYFSFGQPLGFIKFNIHFNGGINFTTRPGLINDELNMANSSQYRLGVSLSSNISERLDFRLSTWGRYNVVENTLRPALNNNYYTQTTRFNYNWLFGDGFVLRSDVNYQLNTGLSEGFDNSFLLWNLSMGKKFLKNKLAEVSINAYDLLKQNNNIRRNVSEIFIEDMQSNVLQRYVMLSLTYNFRRFSRGASMDDFEEIETN